jgi:AMIN domain
MKFPSQAARTWPVSVLCASLLAGVSLAPAAAQTAQVQGVKLLPSTGAVELEIQMNQPVAPRSQVVPSPDRLVIDFPGATPGPQLRALAVNRGNVVGVRVGLFESRPPTTRVVLDLKSATAFQIFPTGKSVMVKLGGPSNAIPAGVAPAAAAEPPPEPPKPKVTVAFRNGLLSVTADKATLAQVLYEIHNQTGAEIAVPAGAEQEQVFAALGPAAPKEVLAALLDGSPYNFILVGSSSNPNVLERVLLSHKGTNMVLDVGMPQGQSQPTMAGAPAYVNNDRMANARNRSVAPADQEPEDPSANVAPEDEPPAEAPPAEQQPPQQQQQPPQGQPAPGQPPQN